MNRSLNFLSKERALLQEPHSLLEQERILANEALAECKSHCDRLETIVDELNKNLEDGHKTAWENEAKTQKLVRQLKVITDYGLFQFLYWDLSICLL